MNEHIMPIPSRIYNAAVGGHVCGPEDIDFGQKVIYLIKCDRNGNEVSFESQVTQTNKIYVIHDDFVLSSDITIPTNCVLEFNGGSISGNKIKFQNTELVGDVNIRSRIDTTSVIKNSVINVSWFTNPNNRDTEDNSVAINDILAICKNYTDSLFPYGITVYLPSGTYYAKEAPITIPNGCKVSIKGDGSKITKVVASWTEVGNKEYLFGRSLANSKAFDSNSPGSRVDVEGISFDGNYRTENTLNLSKHSHSNFKDIIGTGGIYTNLYINAAYTTSFYNCFFNGWDVQRPTNISAYIGPDDVNAVSFENCRFAECNLGVYSRRGYGHWFHNCTFEGCYTAAIMISRGDGIVVDGCYFESNSTKKDYTLNQFDSTKFGFRGAKIIENSSEYDVNFEIHADIILNNYSIVNTNEDFTDSKLALYTDDNSYNTIQKKVSITNCIVQRVNACTNDNPYSISISNDCFVFAFNCKSLTLENNSIQSIYADEVNGVYRWTNNYTTIPLILGTYKNDSPLGISLINNKSNNTIKDIFDLCTFYVNRPGTSSHCLLLTNTHIEKISLHWRNKIEGSNINLTKHNGKEALQAVGLNTLIYLENDEGFKAGDLVFLSFDYVTTGTLKIYINNKEIGTMSSAYKNVSVVYKVSENISTLNVSFALIDSTKEATVCFPNANVNNLPIEIKRKIPTSGISRPANVDVGYQFLDLSSGVEKPIWYKGNNVWVDATGTTV